MLTPYSQKLSLSDARHLLGRVTFASSWKTIKSFENLTATQAVNLLFDNALKNPAPTAPAWKDDAFKMFWTLPKDEIQKALDEIYGKVYGQNYELKRWWMEAMKNDTASIREKLTLFWHGHFTTKFVVDEPMPAQLIYKQNKLFRDSHQGNFKKLVENIILDPAMLIFLNGNGSNKKAPNENFSRELLELYTCGIGNYTETDVKEGARVFSGWYVSIYSDEGTPPGVYVPFFVPENHDTYSKTYLGRSIPATTQNTQEAVLKNEIKYLVDIIHTERKGAVARFICEKLYRFFVYSSSENPPSDVIADMMEIFSRDWEIKPVLMALLQSQHFFDTKNRSVQIKTPAETVVGITAHFDVDGEWKEWVMVTMGQELLNPPNVAGWPGYRQWLDSRTFPFAVQQLGYFIWNQKQDYIVKWIEGFDAGSDPKVLIERILRLFFAKEPNTAQVDKYTKILLSGSPDYEWANILKNEELAAFRLKIALIEMIKSPAFHLN
jgi:uncharacterized protein (DUF1800 family)